MKMGIFKGRLAHGSSCFLLLLLAVPLAIETRAQVVMFVSEYNGGNLRAFDYNTGNPLALPPSYTPVGGSTAGADGMVTDSLGRLYVNRDGGAIYRRNLDGVTFSVFATITGSPTLLDLTRNNTHLFAASYGTPNIFRVSLADGTYTTLTGPSGFDTADGVRIGPDGRLYAVDSSDGQIFAYDPSASTWATFLAAPLTAGIASQMEFYGDYVFVSRTIGSSGRIYRYTLYNPGDYASGLNPASETLIGTIGFTTATGIRIGPDGRLYANAFNSGEVWRSDVGITSMETSPFVTGLNSPGSIYFALIPEPVAAWLLPVCMIALAVQLHRRRSA